MALLKLSGASVGGAANYFTIADMKEQDGM